MSIEINYGGRKLSMRSPKEGESKADWVAAQKLAQAFKGKSDADKVLGELYDKAVPPKPAKAAKAIDNGVGA